MATPIPWTVKDQHHCDRAIKTSCPPNHYALDRGTLATTPSHHLPGLFAHIGQQRVQQWPTCVTTVPRIYPHHNHTTLYLTVTSCLHPAIVGTCTFDDTDKRRMYTRSIALWRTLGTKCDVHVAIWGEGVAAEGDVPRWVTHWALDGPDDTHFLQAIDTKGGRQSTIFRRVVCCGCLAPRPSHL